MTRDPIPNTVGYLYMVNDYFEVDPDHVVFYKYDGGNEAIISWTNGYNPIDPESYTINSAEYRGSTEFYFAPLDWLKR